MYSKKESTKIINTILEFEQWSNPDMNIILESDINNFHMTLQNKYGVFIDDETGYVLEVDGIRASNGLFSTIKNKLKAAINSTAGFLKNIIKAVWNFFKAHWKLMVGVLAALGAGFGAFSAATQWKQITGNAIELTNQSGPSLMKTDKIVTDKLEKGIAKFEEKPGFKAKVESIFNQIFNTYDIGYQKAKSIFQKRYQEAMTGKDNTKLEKLKGIAKTMASSTKDMINCTKNGVKSMMLYAKNQGNIRNEYVRRAYEKAAKEIPGNPEQLKELKGANAKLEEIKAKLEERLDYSRRRRKETEKDLENMRDSLPLERSTSEFEGAAKVASVINSRYKTFKDMKNELERMNRAYQGTSNSELKKLSNELLSKYNLVDQYVRRINSFVELSNDSNIPTNKKAYYMREATRTVETVSKHMVEIEKETAIIKKIGQHEADLMEKSVNWAKNQAKQIQNKANQTYIKEHQNNLKFGNPTKEQENAILKTIPEAPKVKVGPDGKTYIPIKEKKKPVRKPQKPLPFNNFQK